MNDRNSSRSDATIITASLTQPPMFATLFDRHASVIWRYAQRRGGPDAANEVVDETFLRAFAARAGYDERHSDARPWLYGIATNVLRGQSREGERRRRAYARAAERDEEDGGLDRAEARADAAMQGPGIAAALMRLEPVDRDTLLLFALTELDYQGIATAMAVPLGTVRSRLHRARQQIQMELGLLKPEAVLARSKNDKDQL